MWCLASCLLTLIQRRCGFSASCCFLPHTPAGLSDPHWLSQSHACTLTYTDEHMIGYKYSGRDRHYVQRNVHQGQNTRCAHFNPATKLSVSTFLWGKKTNLRICLSDAVHLGRLVCECAQRSPNPSIPRIAVVLLARTVLIRCVSRCMTSQASGDVRVRGAVWKAHVQHSESHYTTAGCNGGLKAGHKWRQ